jgi:uncharacterized membrane protein
MVIVCPSLTKATASSMLTSLSGIARMKCAATKKLFGSIGEYCQVGITSLSSYPYEVKRNCYCRCYLLYALQLLRVHAVVFIIFIISSLAEICCDDGIELLDRRVLVGSK